MSERAEDSSEDFDAYQLKRLNKCFKRIDTDKSGTLSRHKILSLRELKKNPLASRMADILDIDKNDEIDFKKFKQGVKQFRPESDKMIKLKVLFNIFDSNNDGYISNAEVFKVLKMFIVNIGDVSMQQIVDKTFLLMNKGPDDMINFDEFCKLISSMNSNIYKKMVVDI